MNYWQGELFCHPNTPVSKPLVASSACLLGEPVRYDGGHTEQSIIAEELLPWLQLEAICPEVGIGLGVPRPTLDGISTAQGVRIVLTEDHSQDLTTALENYADNYINQVGTYWPLCAYIFKARSPSCGVGTLPLDRHLGSDETAYGAFAGRVADTLPWLHLLEEENLNSKQDCEDLLLLCYLCRDILWQGKAADELMNHYQPLLGTLYVTELSALGIWVAVKTLLLSDNEKRRHLIAQYRAV